MAAADRTIRIKLPFDFQIMELSYDDKDTIESFQDKALQHLRKALREKLGLSPQDLEECKREIDWATVSPTVVPRGETKFVNMLIKDVPTREFKLDLDNGGVVLKQKIADTYSRLIDENSNLKIENLTLQDTSEVIEPKPSLAKMKKQLKTLREKYQLIETDKNELDLAFKKATEAYQEAQEKYNSLNSKFNELKEENELMSQSLNNFSVYTNKTDRLMLRKLLEMIARRKKHQFITAESLKELGLTDPQIDALLRHKQETNNLIHKAESETEAKVETERILICDAIERIKKDYLKSAYALAYEWYFERKFQPE